MGLCEVKRNRLGDNPNLFLLGSLAALWTFVETPRRGGFALGFEERVRFEGNYRYAVGHDWTKMFR